MLYLFDDPFKDTFCKLTILVPPLPLFLTGTGILLTTGTFFTTGVGTGNGLCTATLYTSGTYIWCISLYSTYFYTIGYVII